MEMKIYFNKVVLLLAVIGALNLSALAQIAAKTECADEKAKAKTVSFDKGKASNAAFIPISKINPPSEKAIATVEKPTVSMRVCEGNVSVRGWQRSEVRVLVNGGKVGFIAKQPAADNKPSWIFIVGYDPKDKISGKKNECLNGTDIEIEVPFGSNVDIKSSDEDVNIESVAKASVRNQRGNISLRDIREEAEVSSYGGGSVLAEDSSGRFTLKSSGGDISANRLRPLNFSDALRINSQGSGNVTLQNISHANIEASSLSGELVYLGALEGGGSYSFNTTNGTVTLFLPTSSSFQFNARMSGGASFNTTFPIKTSANNNLPKGARVVTGVYGRGELATINLIAVSGSLRLQKQ